MLAVQALESAVAVQAPCENRSHLTRKMPDFTASCTPLMGY
jgi:hypothetical protein